MPKPSQGELAYFQTVQDKNFYVQIFNLTKHFERSSCVEKIAHFRVFQNYSKMSCNSSWLELVTLLDTIKPLKRYVHMVLWYVWSVICLDTQKYVQIFTCFKIIQKISCISSWKIRARFLFLRPLGNTDR